MLRLLRRARADEFKVEIPAPVVAQVWRGGRRQTLLSRLLASDGVEIVAMDALAACAVGALCAASSATNVVDGHVAWHAFRRKFAVVTSDPDDIAAFGLGIRIVGI